MTDHIPTDRLITVLNSVNCTAIDNDEGRPGAYLAKVCHAAAERLKELHLVEQKALALAGKPIRVVKPLDGQLDLVEYIEEGNLFVRNPAPDAAPPCMPTPGGAYTITYGEGVKQS